MIAETLTFGGASISLGAFLFNVFLGVIVAYQAWHASHLNKAKNKAEIESAEAQAKLLAGSNDDMLRAKESLLLASQATSQAWEKSAQEWRTQHDKLSEIHEKSREEWHSRNKEANLVVLKLTEENAILKSQTNLEPLMDHMEKMGETMDRMCKVLLALCKSMKIDCDEEDKRREKDA